jgi:S1-C subfamily serine protease
VEGIHDALNAIAQTPPGDAITLNGVRNGEPLELQVVVAERPQRERR